ncbi:MAG: hypothetical protein LC791_07075 [Acidobacteria bacterium]|nr:hypothetical protein [Acidobacteriota bacterium]
MPATTRLIGILLIVLGIVSYVVTGRTSITALIPAFFGAALVMLALVARNESARKHAMHAAVAVGLIGLLATLSRLVPALGVGNLGRPAVLSQLAMAILLGVYVVKGVMSFIEARRGRLNR